MNNAFSRSRLFAAGLFVLAVLAVSGCGSTKTLESGWPERPVVVDGHDDEWSAPRLPLKDNKVSLSAVNDDANLYVRVETRDRAVQAQMLGRGFTVWLAPGGDKSKKFGIRFPLGMQGRGAKLLRRMGRDGGDLEERWPRLEEQMKAFEIVAADGEPLERRLRASSEDIEVSMSYADGLLVYELKVPLAAGEGRAYALGVGPGQTVAVGLETPEIERRERRADLDDGSRRRGRRGGFGDGLGGRDARGQAGGLRPSSPDRLNVWATVRLASPGGAASG
ncbi:hypothetical protein [Rhodocaloribacter sp.]